jgi:hypothetical protein
MACVEALGARRMVEACPALVGEVLAAMPNDMVSNSASAFLKVLLARLRDRGGALAGRLGCGRVAVLGAGGGLVLLVSVAGMYTTASIRCAHALKRLVQLMCLPEVQCCTYGTAD